MVEGEMRQGSQDGRRETIGRVWLYLAERAAAGRHGRPHSARELTSSVRGKESTETGGSATASTKAEAASVIGA